MERELKENFENKLGIKDEKKELDIILDGFKARLAKLSEMQVQPSSENTVENVVSIV